MHISAVLWHVSYQSVHSGIVSTSYLSVWFEMTRGKAYEQRTVSSNNVVRVQLSYKNSAGRDTGERMSHPCRIRLVTTCHPSTHTLRLEASLLPAWLLVPILFGPSKDAHWALSICSLFWPLLRWWQCDTETAHLSTSPSITVVQMF